MARVSTRILAILSQSACLFALIDARPAAAQQTAQATASAGSGLEEIVVTARRREERLQTVPLAITAFTSADLESHAIQNFTDLQHDVPSFTYSPSQRSGIAAAPLLRGLPGVVTYFSEVPLLVGNQVGDSYAFDSSIQVLKGPQGTLFGQNTTGGAILLQPTRPTPDFEGYAQIQLGGDNWQHYRAVINIPIVEDKLMVRGAFEHEQRDGFTTVAPGPFAGRFAGLDLDNRDSWYGRISAVFRPTDDIENYFVADEVYVHTNGSALVLQQINPDNFGPLTNGVGPNSINYAINKPPLAVATPFQILAAQQKLGVRQILGFDPVVVTGGVQRTFTFPGPIEKAQNIDIADILRWDVTDDSTIKNIAGYVNARQLTRADFTDTPFVTQGFVSPRGWNNAGSGAGGGVGLATQYTDELAFQSKTLNDKLQYNVGAFLRYFAAGPQSGQITTGNAGLTQILVDTGGSQSARTQALYAQGTYDMSGLWSDLQGLKFTAGYRYNWDWASATQHIKIVSLAGIGNFNICSGGRLPTCDLSNDGHFHSPGWNLSLDYAVDPETLVYVRSSKGYRPGGFTPPALDVNDQTFQPENLVDVEVGIKSTWDIYGIQARTNVDAYHGWYTNIQTGVTSFVIINGARSNFGVTENAASATAEGFEGEFSILPTEGLELRANMSFNHNVYDSFTSATFGQLSGRSFAGFPKLKVDLGATYHLPIDKSLGDISLGADWSYQTHYFLATDNGPSASPTHRLLNLRVDWNDLFGHPFDLSFFMTNVTDATFITGVFGLYNQQGFVSNLYNEPREWAFALKYRFGPGLDPI